MSNSPTEETAPYGTGAGKPAGAAKRIRTQHLREMKERGERFAMLTAYDMYTAQIFDEAGIEVLLVGDSASQQRLRQRDLAARHRRRADPADPRGVAVGDARRWWSATCRSAPTSARPSRPTTPPCGS